MQFYIKYTEISVVKCNLNTDPCNQRKQAHPTISPEIVPSLVPCSCLDKEQDTTVIWKTKWTALGCQEEGVSSQFDCHLKWPV